MCVSVRACMHVCVCVCACMHASMQCAYVFMCVCVLDREGSRVFASKALGVVKTAVHLTDDSDCLTAFHEPLLPTSGCHTSLKNAWHAHCTITDETHLSSTPAA